MMELSEKKEFQTKQRAAVCYSQFEKGRSKSSATIGEDGDETLFFSESAKQDKTLNKPFRTPKGPKKFSVYVKNE